MSRHLSLFNLISLVLGLSFLYVPLVILVTYSFNASKLVAVWGGFSFKWYGVLFHDQQMLSAAWITLQVGVISATLGTILGTMTALILVRIRRFPGRTLFMGMTFAPLVMPDVITGLSLLLLFIAMGIERGVLTVVLAHTTFLMCYVAVVVTARLKSFDQALEEAALDLGCTPLSAFRLVTLPIIAPAIISGWLLAFTLSLDDLVIASFTTGPASTTLPIKIYSSIRLGVSPEINALSTILLVLVATGVVAASLISRRAIRRRQRDETLARHH
ncbi:ABC transporter permease subunit [Martelella alba]|uniref:ABC transporter permease subunit n=1 Tax=Martelella alba TaxID=2590451 RepID=A0A506U381_9HYPH|nr:ABC transporter permease subunit [Martelella alba]TPW28280.1 ABC transporter permease subunit [Martelella alba]